MDYCCSDTGRGKQEPFWVVLGLSKLYVNIKRFIEYYSLHAMNIAVESDMI